MRVLVTGGAGYIGSVAVEQLLGFGHTVFVLDNLWRGHAKAVHEEAQLLTGDLRDLDRVRELVKGTRPDAVMHFAAATLVPESMLNPELYFDVNVTGTHNLLAACRAAGVDRFVFSSTAAVYGVPTEVPITESSDTRPINVYGHSKRMVEHMLEAYAQAYGLRYAALRYFNVAGASQKYGEDHDPETHVIPVALQTLLGQRAAFSVYGTDYPTPDGSAIRDYVHVLDLADAHVRALDQLDESLGPLNLGTRTGFSVLEIVSAVERVTGRTLPVKIIDRRAGDPPLLIADATRANQILGWRPERSTLDEMIGSAWEWLQRQPDGYGS
ncbi:MAG: UDP-glucose 4-epimerase GalE [Chloroflexota bacterium]|nr:UDP-glucose 4-epimerase GalE [Chloroflexota bacterium]